jgi:hypothetical protein
VRIKSLLILSVVVAAMALATPALAAPLTFEVTYDATAGATPVDGRIIVIAADRFYADWYPEPRFVPEGEGAATPPFWGKTVEAMAPGSTVTLGDNDGVCRYPLQAIAELLAPGSTVTLGDGDDVYGYPLPTIAELPEGDYWVQAVLNKHTTFDRADGFSLKAFLPGGSDNDAMDNPGSLYSDPQLVHIAPDGGPVKLSLTHVVQPQEPVPPGGTAAQGNPTDSKHVKHVKIRSELLSDFWGQDMFLGADVLLPSGYFKKANRQRKYPVIYFTFHYPRRNPGGFVEPPAQHPSGPNFWYRDGRFSEWWLSGKAPQVMFVAFREENPYGSTAYQTDSPNVGPYDTAEKTELVPDLQSRFRIYGAGWARTCFGISSGGWMAAAQQIYHPEYYAGAWVFAPDFLSFTAAPTADLYHDDNYYYTDYGWMKVLRPGAVLPNHEPADTIAQNLWWEAALTGPDGYVTNGWSIGLTQAIWGPQGPDGYYAPAWDKLGGKIDHAVTEQMKAKDLTEYTRSNWSTIGEDLRGKLHIYVGTRDEYNLDNGVQVFETMAEELTAPKADFDIHYVVNAGHVFWPQVGKDGGLVGLVKTMAGTMRDAAPTEAKKWWWYAAN